ncbi:aldo/keto reductase [Secundilactobacillus muriivasis]
MQTITLNNGVKMPQLGLGVFQILDSNETQQTVLTAIKHGYRLFDTAAAYHNEAAVGEALKASGVPREELFITSKLWIQDMTYEGAKAGLQRALDLLQLDYIDLYLLHQPIGDIYGAWRALEEAYHAGKIRAIGVSNFTAGKLAEFELFTDVKPAVNQVDLNVFNQQPDDLKFMQDRHIQPEAWGPFAEGKHGIFTDPTLTQIGQQYGKTPAQVALRWLLQRGVVVIPKSTHEQRMVENMAVFDFALTDADMAAIEAINLNASTIDHEVTPALIDRFLTIRVHD